jgi:hypothetical protein
MAAQRDCRVDQGARAMSAREERRAQLHAAGDWPALMEECEPIIRRLVRGHTAGAVDDAVQTLREEALRQLPAWQPSRANLNTYLQRRLSGALMNALSVKEQPFDGTVKALGYRFAGQVAAPAAVDDDGEEFPDTDDSDVPAGSADHAPWIDQLVAADGRDQEAELLTPRQRNAVFDRASQLLGAELMLALSLDCNSALTDKERAARFAVVYPVRAVHRFRRRVEIAYATLDRRRADILAAARDCKSDSHDIPPPHYLDRRRSQPRADRTLRTDNAALCVARARASREPRSRTRPTAPNSSQHLREYRQREAQRWAAKLRAHMQSAEKSQNAQE